MQLQFDAFVLDTDRAELRGPQGLVALEPKTFALLCLLAENHARFVSRDEMIAAVWGGRIISDAAVSTVLKSVRKALGDDGQTQRYIRTIRGRGHRFVGDVTIRAAPAAAPAPASAPVPSTAEPRADGRPTVAVLPFLAMDLPARFASLADAIPADIISSLARLRWIRVIARESSFRFRGTQADPAGLRSVLGAGYGLGGRVEVLGGRIAVDVDLSETRSGGVIWSEHFERAIDDVHDIRREIVSAVIGALDLQIPLTEAASARQKPVEHLDAWSAYHLGLNHMYRFNAADNAVAAGFFGHAIRLDPGFAGAYAARSFTGFQNVFMGYASDRAAAIAATRADAEHSIELDPLDPFANFAMGRLAMLGGTPDDGLSWLERSVAISPSYAKGHYALGFLNMYAGRSKATRAAVDAAMRLSPLDPLLGPMRTIRGHAHAMEGDVAAGADWAVFGARISQGHIVNVMAAAALCQLAGRGDEARHWARIARDRRPDATIALFCAAMPLARADYLARCAGALRQLGLPEGGNTA